MFIAYAGGAALDGHDGWLTYCGPANGGLINLDSIEVDESMYPIIIESRGVRPDTQGFGKFEGAPGVECVFYPVDHAMTVIYAADGTSFPPKGVNGGLPAAASWTRKQSADGQLVDLPAFHQEVCKPGEKMVCFACGGGGYGAPAERDPRRVVAAVNRGALTPDKAQEIYGVSIRYDESIAEYRLVG